MKKENSITRFGLIRHAQTIWNREKRIQGRQDSPLTKTGEKQAAVWATVLQTIKWDGCLSSDIGRARNTANIVNTQLKLPLTCDAGLREQDWGAWVGKTLRELETNFLNVLTSQVESGWRFCPPGGEDRISVLSRGQAALKAATVKWPSATILVVTHEGLIKCLVYHCLGRRFLPSEPRILKSAHLHWLICDGSELQVEEINAVALDGA